ncbi:10876_t:CDS:2 [Funneliformis geosporum]|uniref:11886_t:CDS:1 n=1 Tax=Funneliformis geosporum TaxID=1117311 RepID=A0A9W4SQS3_9GLOM|nr:10876_t:CDS:2 [Funneliformis geosporum]CAI2177160.1 11886_t:CDS:2 [Funneliformis geosporum]
MIDNNVSNGWAENNSNIMFLKLINGLMKNVKRGNLVLNCERSEEQYVDTRLANMLINAGVKSIKLPNFKIVVKQHEQSKS